MGAGRAGGGAGRGVVGVAVWVVTVKQKIEREIFNLF
jgi:hypothetical protein